MATNVPGALHQGAGDLPNYFGVWKNINSGVPAKYYYEADTTPQPEVNPTQEKLGYKQWVAFEPLFYPPQQQNDFSWAGIDFI